MIEMKGDTLIVSFPELEPAKLHIKLQRTLRIPDDGHDYPLPPGLGAFPLRHVDERLSTLEALSLWNEMKPRQQRKYRTIDSLAAAFILERHLKEH